MKENVNVCFFLNTQYKQMHTAKTGISCTLLTALSYIKNQQMGDCQILDFCQRIIEARQFISRIHGTLAVACVYI